MPKLGFAAALVAALGLAGGASEAQGVAEFYRGANLKLIISSGPGGGYDTYSRLLARHLGAHFEALSNAETLAAPNVWHPIRPTVTRTGLGALNR
jgi:tripartite-type tricarboxylate transporter receptor subunit TctC